MAVCCLHPKLGGCRLPPTLPLLALFERTACCSPATLIGWGQGGEECGLSCGPSWPRWWDVQHRDEWEHMSSLHCCTSLWYLIRFLKERSIKDFWFLRLLLFGRFMAYEIRSTTIFKGSCRKERGIGDPRCRTFGEGTSSSTQALVTRLVSFILCRAETEIKKEMSLYKHCLITRGTRLSRGACKAELQIALYGSPSQMWAFTLCQQRMWS